MGMTRLGGGRGDDDDGGVVGCGGVWWGWVLVVWEAVATLGGGNGSHLTTIKSKGDIKARIRRRGENIHIHSKEYN